MPKTSEYFRQQNDLFEFDQNAVRSPISVEPLNNPAPAPLPRPVEIPERLPRVVEETAPAPRRRINLFYVVLILIAAVMLCKIVSAYAEITSIAIKTSKAESEITALQKEQSSLNLQITKKLSLVDIKKYAENELGMYAPKDSDIRILYGGDESFYVADVLTEKPGIAATVWGTIQNVALKAWSFLN